jgi:hypothetical protein
MKIHNSHKKFHIRLALISSLLMAFINVANATNVDCQNRKSPDIFWYLDFDNVGAKIVAPKSTTHIKWTHVTENVLTYEDINDDSFKKSYILNRVNGTFTHRVQDVTAGEQNRLDIIIIMDCKKSGQVNKKF